MAVHPLVALRGDGAPGGGFRVGLGAQQPDAQQLGACPAAGGHGGAEGARVPEVRGPRNSSVGDSGRIIYF